MLAAGAVLAGAAAAPASAADLLVLEGDDAVLNGPASYGIVYVDGTLRLAGDTGITAQSIYIGPNARVLACHVPGTGDDACGPGRNLGLKSSGPITVAQSIDLTGGSGGGAGAVRPGGSLYVSGGDVAIGGTIYTGGDNGRSGNVTVLGSGTVETGDIRSPGAAVEVRGTQGVSVAGDIDVSASGAIPPAGPGVLQGGGTVAVGSVAGDAAIRGSIFAGGRDSGTAGIGGGPGGTVAVAGGDVRLGGADTSGGSASSGPGAWPGGIGLAARGSLDVLGRLDASGGGASTGPAAGGARIEVRAGGPAVIAGGATSAGGSSQAGGAPGGAIDLAGGALTAGNLTTTGGSGGGASPSAGGNGGLLRATSGGRTSVGNLTAAGGNASNGAGAGAGGPIGVNGATVSTGSVNAAGGSASGFSGAPGGPVSLSSDGSLAVGGAVTTSGSGAYQNLSPAPLGAPAGRILLRAASGRLSLGGPVRAEGGDGGPNSVDGQRGGTAGAGGQIDIVARTVGQVVAISSAGGRGGDYGDDQGVGGAGGAIRGWTDAPLFDDQKLIAADGGDGQPAGTSGGRSAEASPADAAISGSTFTFTSRSPDAQAYRVLRSLSGGPFTPVAVRSAAGAVPISAPACVSARFTVVAVHPPVGWVSDAAAPVAWTAQPSRRQRCTDAPAVSARSRVVRRSLRALRAAKWRVRVKVRSTGMGALEARLLRQRRTLASVRQRLGRAGTASVRLTLPRAARRAGRYVLRLRAGAPVGKKATTTTLTLEVTR